MRQIVKHKKWLVLVMVFFLLLGNIPMQMLVYAESDNSIEQASSKEGIALPEGQEGHEVETQEKATTSAEETTALSAEETTAAPAEKTELASEEDNTEISDEEFSATHKENTSTEGNAERGEAPQMRGSGAGIAINETNFPDANFRAIVNGYDTNNDGLLSAEEASITEIDCQNKGIADLAGIEHFTGLKKLFCGNNSLTSLDIGQNTGLEQLYCENNQLGTLDLSNKPALWDLVCFNNQLETLNVSSNPALLNFHCNDNQLSSLDLSQNPALWQLNCKNNKLSSLDLSNNTVLENLYCSNNELTSLNVSNNTNLCMLYCDNNSLTSLDLSQNIHLFILDCSNNELTSLDLSNQPAHFTYLNCSGNNLTFLDLSNLSSLSDSQYFPLAFGNQETDSPLNSVYKDGYYEFDLSAIPGLADKIENVTGVRKADGSALPASSSYDAASGILKIHPNDKAGISSIIYDYDVKMHAEAPGFTEERMDVKVLNLTYASVYTVTLNPDNGGIDTAAVITVAANSGYTLPDCTFTAPEGRQFKAWFVNGSEKVAGDQITVTGNIEITAVWENSIFTVTYQNEAGDTIGTPQNIVYGGDAVPETVPVKMGYTGEWDHDGKNITEDKIIKPIYTEIKMIEETPTWTQGSEEEVVFVSNAEIEDFLCVKINGEVVAPENYEVREGSTIIILKPEFVKTLPPGDYSVEIVSKTGTAVGSVEVKSPTPSWKLCLERVLLWVWLKLKQLMR